METKTLFHAKDPETSRQAAEKMVVSGKLNASIEEIRQAIDEYPDDEFTAKELAEHSGLNYIDIQKRLSVISRQGKIERIEIGRKKAYPESACSLIVPLFKERNNHCVWRLI